MIKSILYLIYISSIFFSAGVEAQENHISAVKNKQVYANINKRLGPAKWNQLFPHRLKLIHGHKTIDFFNYPSFLKACNEFPEFLNEKDTVLQKRELAAFLAYVAMETSGGWDMAPDGFFKYGFYFNKEHDGPSGTGYIDTVHKHFPPFEGKMYYGRGAGQLTWNYNYGQFSKVWFGDSSILLKNPDLLEEDPQISFASALWFWTTPQPPKPSCHNIMSGEWIPGPVDSLKGIMPGFGATVNVINGGIECGSGTDNDRTKHRYQYYLYFCRFFKVDPGEFVTCTSQQPFGQ